MKLKVKEITLKSDIKKGLEDGAGDSLIPQFITYIKEHISDANFLINNRIDMMDKDTLYNALIKIFDITFDKNDYLRILSKMNNHHYIDYIRLKTRMLKNNKMVVLFGAATSKNLFYDETTLDVKTLRKLIASGEFLVLGEEYEDVMIKNPERYENYQYMNVDINADIILPSSELFSYAKEMIRKEVLVKELLYTLKWYVKEIIFQARGITDYASSKNENLSLIGKKYQRALAMAFNDGVIPKREKVSVRKHKKIKVRENS